MDIDEARRHFFVEGEEALSSFALKGWRGAALDRDRYGTHRMPRLLWDALRSGINEAPWLVCGYAPMGHPSPAAAEIDSTWEGFEKAPGNPARTSPEWVAYDGTYEAAILAGFDVTIVGLGAALASRVDELLAADGTSLLTMTRADLGDEGDWPFLASVVRSS